MMKNLVTLSVIVYAFGLVHTDSELFTSFSHPDKISYQSQTPNSDKHKYGYELKENRHFHHTTTEKDGVRLGCYGYELDGKKFSTHYVADSRGYRTVSTNNLITVYPKSGGTRQASFQQEFKEDPSLSSNIRYFFPEGCKEHAPRLPVTLKTTESTPSSTPANTYLPVPVPSNVYIPPGPPHIYAPNQIPISVKPSNIYLPVVVTTTKATNTYLPPANPTTTSRRPQTTTESTNTYLPPANPTTTSRRPLTTTESANTYLPPAKPTNTYLPAEKPVNVDLPAHNSSIVLLPPVKPPAATINLEIVPPPIPTDTCGSSLSCCEEATDGKIVIPIPLKSNGSNRCCGRVAKLILPVNGLDKESIRKLSTSLPEEIDISLLIKNILQNFL